MGVTIDITGQVFGRLTVLRRVENDKYSRAVWECRCECGNIPTVSGKQLRSGKTKSCGCLCRENASKRSLKDRTGQRYGMLLVISRADDYVAPNGNHHVMWLCKCDCGNEVVVDTCSLHRTNKYVKSCGCLKSRITGLAHTTHGGRKDRLYKVYANMKNRCYNPNATDYRYYVGRGIQICNEWLNDYQSFKDWANSSGYDPFAEKGKCTIDGIDVNGDYSPDNCRWVDMATQSRNRRNVINKLNDKCPRKDSIGAQAEIA